MRSAGDSLWAGRRKVGIVAASVAFVIMAVPGGSAFAAGNGPDGGTAHTSITVVPADDLPDTVTVQVSGSGWPASSHVSFSECSRLPGTEQWRKSGRQEVVCTNDFGVAVTDANGNFGPAGFVVKRTFEGGDRHGNPVTYTCLPQDDCMIVTGTAFNDPKNGSQPDPNWLAWHHLSFAS